MGNVHMEATQINYRGGSKKMSVEEAIKAAGTEITPEEKEWIDTIPELASQEIIAPEFDAEEGVYAVGDMVIYQGGLYQFTTAHEMAGAWNPEEVAAVKISDELDALKSGLIDVSTNVGDYCRYNTLPNPVESQTKDGVAVVRESDGRLKFNNTATANTSFILVDNVKNEWNGMRLVGCPLNGSDSTYRLRFVYKDENNTYKGQINDYGNGINIVGNYPKCSVLIDVFNGAAFDDTIFAPMITPHLDATYADYKPYKDSITNVLVGVESGLNNVYNNAFMYISADPVSDGQTYYIDISDYTFRNTRTGIFVIIGNLTTGTTIVNGIWDANTFIFESGSGVTYDATNQKIVVDEGANAWFIPYLVLPSFVISA